MPGGHLDPHPPVSSARSNPADVISGRFASLSSTAQARGGLLGSSHPRPRADPGRGFWRRVSLGRWHPGVTLDPLVQSTWGSQLCEELSLHGCPVSHPHPTPPTTQPSSLAHQGLTQMPSNSVSFLPFFGLASPWLELPLGWPHHIPSTNRKDVLWTKRGFF